MTKDTFIILISNNVNSARKICENLEDILIPIKYDEFYSINAPKLILSMIIELELNESNVKIIRISDYIKMCNDNSIDLRNYFITYLHLNLI